MLGLGYQIVDSFEHRDAELLKSVQNRGLLNFTYVEVGRLARNLTVPGDTTSNIEGKYQPPSRNGLMGNVDHDKLLEEQLLGVGETDPEWEKKRRTIGRGNPNTGPVKIRNDKKNNAKRRSQLISEVDKINGLWENKRNSVEKNIEELERIKKNQKGKGKKNGNMRDHRPIKIEDEEIDVQNFLSSSIDNNDNRKSSKNEFNDRDSYPPAYVSPGPRRKSSQHQSIEDFLEGVSSSNNDSGGESSTAEIEREFLGTVRGKKATPIIDDVPDLT